MVVLEKALSAYYPEIDMVTTPAGAPVAMVHCNNCTNDMNAWVGMLGELAAAMGASGGADALYPLLYRKALEGEPDCGGVLLYNYLAGEPITGVEKGHPLLLRSADSRFTLANFCRASLYATLATLKVGMRMYIKVDKDTQTISDVKFNTFGCGSAIATSSMATEMIKGKPVTDALALSNKAVVEALDGLPAYKLHCSVLAEQAVKAAVKDYYDKNGITYGKELNICDHDCEHCAGE